MLPRSVGAGIEEAKLQVLDGIESGADEVLADEMTRAVRAGLGPPLRER